MDITVLGVHDDSGLGALVAAEHSHVHRVPAGGHAQLGSHGIDKGSVTGGVAAVVGHLQQVHIQLGAVIRHQLALGILVDIAGEEGAVLTVVKAHHQGGVVHVGDIVHNGLMKDLSVLLDAPFADYGSIVEVFTDLTLWFGIKKVIDQINANAIAA